MRRLLSLQFGFVSLIVVSGNTLSAAPAPALTGAPQSKPSAQQADHTNADKEYTSVYTVNLPTPDGPSQIQRRLSSYPLNDQAYQLAVIRFEDAGTASDANELREALECIRHARENAN